MYRLNCQLPDDYREKLELYTKRNSTTITALVMQALDHYFQVDDIKAAFIQRMKDDPTVIAQMAAMFGAVQPGQQPGGQN